MREGGPRAWPAALVAIMLVVRTAPAGEAATPTAGEWLDSIRPSVELQEFLDRTIDELLARARRLTNRYLPDHAARVVPASVRWVTNQNGRWGSCTPDDGTIRISHRIQEMPDWVIDYVLLHELSHLVVPSHSARFWDLVNRYPKAERARGYLEGISAATGVVLADD